MFKKRTSYDFNYFDFWGKQICMSFTSLEDLGRAVACLATRLIESCRGNPLRKYEFYGPDVIGWQLVNISREREGPFPFVHHFMVRAMFLDTIVRSAVTSKTKPCGIEQDQAKLITQALDEFKKWLDEKCEHLLGTDVELVEHYYHNWTECNEAFLALWDDKTGGE